MIVTSAAWIINEMRHERLRSRVEEIAEPVAAELIDAVFAGSEGPINMNVGKSPWLVKPEEYTLSILGSVTAKLSCYDIEDRVIFDNTSSTPREIAFKIV